MKLESILQEIISDIVWHATSIDSAILIIEKNYFLLSQVDVDWEYTSDSKGKYYFLSTARQPHGGYVEGLVCRFELDGRKLSQNYHGKAFNYFRNQFNGNKDEPEFEDRIFSKDHKILNARKYIKSLEYLNNKILLKNKEHILVSTCLENKIPCFKYETEKDFNLRKNKINMNNTNNIPKNNFDSYNKIDLELDESIGFYIDVLLKQGTSKKTIRDLFINNEENEIWYYTLISTSDDKKIQYYYNIPYEKYIDDLLDKTYEDINNFDNYEYTDKDIKYFFFDTSTITYHIPEKTNMQKELINLILKNARKEKIKYNNLIPYIQNIITK